MSTVASALLDQLRLLLTQLQFLRPWWLLAILPALALAIALWRQPGSGANWRRAIAPDLLAHLLTAHSEHRQRWPWLALTGWIIAAIAVAGPAWEKLPQPVLQKRDAAVIVLDLSLSMYAEDIQPSRLQRARFKVLDMLKRRNEGLTGLVVYSGDAHVVSPLTDDTATIANLVPALAPDMMPQYGSDPVAGIEQALQLLRNAGFERGRIVLVSDEISDANIDAISSRIGAGHWQLSILGVGTEQGAPIPVAGNQSATNSAGANAGGFLKQRDGSIVVAQLHRARFEQLARASNGIYSDLRVDDKDLDSLLPPALPSANETRSVQREFDSWRERGPWLAMLLLPIAALVFRRGWLLILLLAPLLSAVPLSAQSQAQDAVNPAQQNNNPQAGNSHAINSDAHTAWSDVWRNLWQRPDQQAQQAFEHGDNKAAAEKFRDPAWKGAALYRAGDYAGAAQTLQNSAGADADYNRGNALAHAGELQEAIAAYDAALAKNPKLADAAANRELVKKLLQQQPGQNPHTQDQKQQSQNQQQQNQQSQQNQGNSEKNSASGQDGNQDSQQQAANQQAGGPQQNNAQNSSAAEQSSMRDQANAQSKSGDQQTAENNAKAQYGKEPPAQEKTQQTATQSSAQQATEKKGEDGRDKADAEQRMAGAGDESKEQQQQQRATEQWLRQIPDDPGGLLRRKFLYEHRQRERSAPRDSQQPLW